MGAAVGSDGSHIFGSDHIDPFGAALSGPGGNQRWDWRAGMERQGSREMAFVKQFFDAHRWHELIPDQDRSVVTGGCGTFSVHDRSAGGDYVTAARTSDGSLVIAYIPSTRTVLRTITVDMKRLNGPAHARWYNPTDGMYRQIAGSPLANDGQRDFSAPGDNGTGTNDWVLLLESKKSSDSAVNFTSSTPGWKPIPRHPQPCRLTT